MHLNVFHTNDIHANYDNLRNIYSYLKDNRSENDFYFDSGDFTDLKDLIVQADQGVSAIEILNKLKPDCMTVGNNEIDIGYDGVSKISENINMVCCNITDNDNKHIAKINDYLILEKVNKRFLVIGIAPYYSTSMQDNNFNGFFCLYGLKVHPSIETIRKIINKNKGKYDFCILLAHNGLEVEKQIQKEIPEINLILGGHSHSVVSSDNYNQCGLFGEYLGKVTLDINDEKITIVDNQNIKLDKAKNLTFDKILNKKKVYADKILSNDLKANEELLFDAYKECPLINFVCDALYDGFEGDFAIMHNGIANFSLKQPVSRKTLIECFPSKLNPTMYKIKGDKIFKAIKLSLDEKHIHQDGKGAGFRGSALGTLSYSHNVRIVENPLQVYIDNEPLENDKTYSIITDDYLQRGTGYPSLKVSDDDATWHVWYIRDLMLHYINNQKIYDQAKLKRK